MRNRECGNDREFIRAVSTELIVEKLQAGELQAGLYDCEKGRIGQWTKVALCTDIPEITVPQYVNCAGEPIADGATLVTCTDLTQKINDIPKIVAFSARCDEQDVEVTFSDGHKLIMDLSCFLSGHDDTYVVSGAVKGKKLMLTRTDGEVVTIDLSGIAGTGGGGGSDGNTTVVSLTYEGDTLTLRDSDGGELSAQITTQRSYVEPMTATDTSPGLPYETIGNGAYTLTKPDRMEKVLIEGDVYYIPAYRAPEVAADAEE